MLLQFLYTGEVGKKQNSSHSRIFIFHSSFVFPDLISASQLLVEFQELCRILKLNPQVRKTKYVEGLHESIGKLSKSRNNDLWKDLEKLECNFRKAFMFNLWFVFWQAKQVDISPATMYNSQAQHSKPSIDDKHKHCSRRRLDSVGERQSKIASISSSPRRFCRRRRRKRQRRGKSQGTRRHVSWRIWIPDARQFWFARWNHSRAASSREIHFNSDSIRWSKQRCHAS